MSVLRRRMLNSGSGSWPEENILGLWTITNPASFATVFPWANSSTSRLTIGFTCNRTLTVDETFIALYYSNGFHGVRSNGAATIGPSVNTGKEWLTFIITSYDTNYESDLKYWLNTYCYRWPDLVPANSELHIYRWSPCGGYVNNAYWYNPYTFSGTKYDYMYAYTNYSSNTRYINTGFSLTNNGSITNSNNCSFHPTVAPARAWLSGKTYETWYNGVDNGISSSVTTSRNWRNYFMACNFIPPKLEWEMKSKYVWDMYTSTAHTTWFGIDVTETADAHTNDANENGIYYYLRTA